VRGEASRNSLLVGVTLCSQWTLHGASNSSGAEILARAKAKIADTECRGIRTNSLYPLVQLMASGSLWSCCVLVILGASRNR
jgi:hypothetical protein